MFPALLRATRLGIKGSFVGPSASSLVAPHHMPLELELENTELPWWVIVAGLVAASTSLVGLSQGVLEPVLEERRVRKANLRDLPISAGGTARLRKRAKWVVGLAEKLGLRDGALGAFLSGRWTPDLPGSKGARSASAYFSSLLVDGARVQGATRVTVAGGHTWVAHVNLGSNRLLVDPQMLAALSSYACFRRRDNALVSALRLRAKEWCKKVGFPDLEASLVVPGTVALATLVSAPEAAGSELLDSRAGVASFEGRRLSWLERLAPYGQPAGYYWGFSRNAGWWRTKV